MTTHERSEKTRQARARGLWMGQQSMAIYEASQDIIAKSIQLMDDVSRLTPTYKASVE
ncbi:hypothetical protein [Roseobacter weihaiensis]|uniref:hypothetical protein n=1 Tax=Roseobacter weihaiensis TaxID=2763262 RepID=UPI001D0A8D2D|nr:hypothetical protein [Roseobacter sp. H9]